MFIKSFSLLCISIYHHWLQRVHWQIAFVYYYYYYCYPYFGYYYQFILISVYLSPLTVRVHLLTNRLCNIIIIIILGIIINSFSFVCTTTDYIVLTVSCFGALKCLSCNFHDRIKTSFIKTQACTFVKIKHEPEPFSRLLRTTWSQPEDVRRFPYMLRSRETHSNLSTKTYN